MRVLNRVISVVALALLSAALVPALCFAAGDGEEPANLAAGGTDAVRDEGNVLYAQAAHEHNWVKITETRNYSKYHCNGCGMLFDTEDAWRAHSNEMAKAGDESHGANTKLDYTDVNTVGYYCPECLDGSEHLTTTTTPSIADLGGVRAMYRLYNPNSGEHFYTADPAERDDVVKAGWRYEGIGWKAPTKSETPVYRLYSGTDHHYTMDADEKDNLIKVGWTFEGTGWYSDDAKGVPLYRQFNPNVQPWAARNNSGSHNYTTSKDENESLVKAGWRAEGIGWYGVK